jgi:hypothetical protein
LRNIEFLNRWADRLINGDDKQCQGYLRHDKDTFCCLGIACDLFDTNIWRKECCQYSYRGCVSELPREIRTFIGITLAESDYLIQLNDIQNKTFKEIGQYIKENIIAANSNSTGS